MTKGLIEKSILFLLIYSIFCTTACSNKEKAALVPKITPSKIENPNSPTPLLGRGINIPSFQSMTDEHFKILHESGFKNVRIPIKPFSETIGDDKFTLKQSFYDKVDLAVNRSLAYDLIPVIDLHEHTAMQANPIGNKPKFLAIWKQLAEHYKNYSSNVLFEIANEPNMSASTWNQILSEAHTIIRESNPNRMLVIGCIYGNQIKYLKDLIIPENDKNVIVAIHYYMPIEFTHQGADWSEDYKNLSGIDWPTATAGEKEVLADFAIADKWSKENNIQLYLGEFGTYKKAPMPARIRWTTFISRQAENLGWSWAYWELNQDFGIFNLTSNTWNHDLYKSLVPNP